MQKKKRKYGERWKEIEIDVAANDAVFDKFFKQPTPPQTSPVDLAHPKTTSLVTPEQEAPPTTSLVKTASLSTFDQPKTSRLDLMQSLPDVDGYTKLWHQMTDHLYGQLTSAEQCTHIQLFRLSWGYGNPTCIIALPKLAKRTGLGQKTIQRAVEGLIHKGLIEKVRAIFGREQVQGIEYRIVPPPSMVKTTRQAKMTSLVKTATIKETELKETPTNKGDVRALSRFALSDCRKYAEHLKASGQGITNPGGYATKIHRSGEADELIERFLTPAPMQELVDASKCPDCQGTGWWYPKGREAGTARCKHERLSQQ